jgi:hypothetical protein
MGCGAVLERDGGLEFHGELRQIDLVIASSTNNPIQHRSDGCNGLVEATNLS